jgi:elongation factor P
MRTGFDSRRSDTFHIMLDINDLHKDTIFLFEGAPFKVLDVQHKKMARQGATVQVKIKNLVSGSTLSRSFFPSDKFEEAELEKRSLIFLYEHRGEYCFVAPKDRSQRFILTADEVGDKAHFLTPNLEVTAVVFNATIISIELPIKVDYKVAEAPPGIKGDTASGGNKQVKLETGAVVQTPLFINAGDTVRVNTEKGEYVERVSKGGS